MISGILDKGGTILGSSRTNPTKDPAMLEKLKENWRASRIDGLVAIGGDDTLSVAAYLSKEGMNVISVPKTIDNDIGFTDYSFGFHTAVGVITDAIDRLRTTAEAHDRVIILEVMGRHSGWLATYAGIAGGADLILVPTAFNTKKSSRCSRRASRAGELRNWSFGSEARGMRLHHSGAGVDLRHVHSAGRPNTRTGIGTA